MRYYVASDIHGFYSEFINELEKSGFMTNDSDSKLILLGDLFDRGKEAVRLQEFIIRLMNEERVILVKGNHEDLFMKLIYSDHGEPYDSHVHNGTYDTALQLTGMDFNQAVTNPMELANKARQTPFVTKIIPAMKDYYETEKYIFVHGFVPCSDDSFRPVPLKEWRKADTQQWDNARWLNGMKINSYYIPSKTICCGHWHASYGHCNIEKIGSEFGKDADFSPFYGRNLISIDACTSYSGKVNIIKLEDRKEESL